MTTRSETFSFDNRVNLAKAYLDDGALLTAADRLESLVIDLRNAATPNAPAYPATHPLGSDRYAD